MVLEVSEGHEVFVDDSRAGKKRHDVVVVKFWLLCLRRSTHYSFESYIEVSEEHRVFIDEPRAEEKKHHVVDSLFWQRNVRWRLRTFGDSHTV
jgi:hypothetical protein